MADCCICGKKVSGWSDKYDLDASGNNVCCYQCAPFFRSLEQSDSREAFDSRLERLKDRIYKEYQVSDEIRTLVMDRADKIERNLGLKAEIEKDCPCCGSTIAIHESTCPACGFIFGQGPKVDIRRRAAIFNQRYEQYDKNPIYEYKVESVRDSGTGVCDPERLQQVISIYASNGWRLISSFSSEIGKNAIGGLNATVDQTILIFERCMKAAE